MNHSFHILCHISTIHRFYESRIDTLKVLLISVNTSVRRFRTNTDGRYGSSTDTLLKRYRKMSSVLSVT